jgi:hypothetical protein
MNGGITAALPNALTGEMLGCDIIAVSTLQLI